VFRFGGVALNFPTGRRPLTLSLLLSWANPTLAWVFNHTVPPSRPTSRDDRQAGATTCPAGSARGEGQRKPVCVDTGALQGGLGCWRGGAAQPRCRRAKGQWCLAAAADPLPGVEVASAAARWDSPVGDWRRNLGALRPRDGSDSASRQRPARSTAGEQAQRGAGLRLYRGSGVRFELPLVISWDCRSRPSPTGQGAAAPLTPDHLRRRVATRPWRIAPRPATGPAGGQADRPLAKQTGAGSAATCPRPCAWPLFNELLATSASGGSLWTAAWSGGKSGGSLRGVEYLDYAWYKASESAHSYGLLCLLAKLWPELRHKAVLRSFFGARIPAGDATPDRSAG